MIICFSGTGNSAAVASRLSVLLDDESLVLLRGEVLIGEKPALTLKGERIIWVFPTYSWGVPPVVADFIRRVEIAGADNVPHFMQICRILLIHLIHPLVVAVLHPCF